MVAPQVALHPGGQDRPEREAEEVGTQRLELRGGAGERVLQSLRFLGRRRGARFLGARVRVSALQLRLQPPRPGLLAPERLGQPARSRGGPAGLEQARPKPPSLRPETVLVAQSGSSQFL